MSLDPIRYPLSVDDRLRTYVIGSLLIVGSILVIPAIILLGYFSRAIGNATDGEDPPIFENFVGLFVDGLKLAIVGIAYAIVVIGVMFLVVFAGAIDDRAGIAAMWIVFIPVYLGLLYLMTGVLYHFSQRQSIRDAFQLRAIARTAFSVRYLVIVVAVVLVLPIMFTIAQLLIAITIVGLVLIPATLLFELLFYANIIGAIER